MNTTEAETPAAAAPAAITTSDSRNLGTLSHLSAFALFLGIPSVAGPLVFWLMKRDDPYVEFQAREALNFNLSFMLYGIVAALSIVVLVGVLLLPAVLITWFILVIRAAIRSSAGEYYRYPMTLRFVG